VAIARALAHRPAFVIADEPTAALDPEAAEAAMGLLIEAAEQGGAAVIVSSHDHGLLDWFAMTRLRLALVPGGADGTVRSVLAAAPEAVA
jgi:putative ABC transport system ATP-binding protein